MAALNMEILIETVQNYPLLYDNSHRDYKNIRYKNKIWDNIAAILDESDGDTLKKQWKNLRDAYSKHLRSYKTSTGQAAKLTDRYKTWPWATRMPFLRPHLEFAETHSNINRNAQETGSSQSANTSSPINTAQSQPYDSSQSQQDNTPQHVHSRRKRNPDQSQSQVDKVINYMSKNAEQDDDTYLLFKSYAKKLKTMNNRRQATVKFKIAKIILKAELEESDEMQCRSDAEQYKENNVVMIVQPPASSAGSDTNNSVYVVSSPPPVFENVDPSNTLSLPPLYMQPTHTLSSNTHTFREDQRPNFIDPSHNILRLIDSNTTRKCYENFGKKS